MIIETKYWRQFLKRIAVLERPCFKPFWPFACMYIVHMCILNFLVSSFLMLWVRPDILAKLLVFLTIFLSFFSILLLCLWPDIRMRLSQTFAIFQTYSTFSPGPPMEHKNIGTGMAPTTFCGNNLFLGNF